MWKSVSKLLTFTCCLSLLITPTAFAYTHTSLKLILQSEKQVIPAYPLKSNEVPEPTNTILKSISAVSKHDIWIVGYQTGGTSMYPWTQALLKHWDGTSWHTIMLPATSTGTTPQLYDAIKALSANNVYAVGDDKNASYISHWNGTSWQPVYTGQDGSGELLALTATDDNDIWAVGVNALVHWDGKSWQRVENVAPNIFRSIAAINRHDIWAVGNDLDMGYASIQHWNGTTWSRIVPPVLERDAILNSVVALDKKNIWIVGQNHGQTYIVHWDGYNWQHISSPRPGVLDNTLLSITAKSKNDIWAVGSTQMNTCLYYCAKQTLIEHWNGQRWQIVKSPDVILPNNVVQDNVLYAAISLSADDVWAVGTSYAGYQTLYKGNTLIEHWDGSSCQIIPSV